MQIYGNLFDRGRRQFVKTNGDQTSDTELKKKTNPFVEGNIFKKRGECEFEHRDRLQAERSEASLLESYDDVAESGDVKQ